jgi:hypothetical protein
VPNLAPKYVPNLAPYEKEKKNKKLEKARLRAPLPERGRCSTTVTSNSLAKIQRMRNEPTPRHDNESRNLITAALMDGPAV